MQMRHFAPRTKRQILMIALLSGTISLSPVIAAEQAPIPDFSGLWGRDSLNLESPLSGPGPDRGDSKFRESRPHRPEKSGIDVAC